MASTQKSRESVEEFAILKYLSELGIGFFWKNVSGGFHDGHSFRKHANPFAIRGVADIVGIVGGKFIGLEVKTKTGSVSDYQKAWLKKAQHHGGLVGVVRSVEETRKLFQSWELIP